MTTVSEAIPQPLQAEVDAALAWFNRTQDVSFEVTGILDPEATLAEAEPRSLRLVLCGGDRCEQHSFLVTREPGGFDVAPLEGEAVPGVSEGAPPAELDPPPGARRGWLDRVLASHRFVVLVFYRGFW